MPSNRLNVIYNFLLIYFIDDVVKNDYLLILLFVLCGDYNSAFFECGP